MRFHSFLSLGFGVVARASVTVYYAQGQQPLSVTSTGSASAASYTGSAAYNPTILNPPPLPNPKPATQFGIQLQPAPQGLSIPQHGAFFGFSIEFSVVNQVLGKNSSLIQVPFLNLMANLKDRGGRVHVRVGGNTQETAVLVENIPDGRILEKDLKGVSNPTQTPPLIFTPDVMYMMGNISSMINVRWYMGLPFNDSSNFRLAIAERGQAILGDHLLGLQAGNEPDLYTRHGHRPVGYSPASYNSELTALIAAMGNDANAKNRNLLIGPNIATGDWTPEMVWDTGFVQTFQENLAALAVEHYPSDNCFAQFGTGVSRTGQDVFGDFLQHASGQNIVRPYINSGFVAQAANKPLLMFETNTASCGGFAGLSDSFGAALWGLDYALQMAYSNFSGALFHVGGQNVFYNPFTSPPTNQSSFHQWTIGPIYYSALAMAETLGSSNKSQVLDLFANNADTHTPAYAIYQDGAPTRVALFNYMTDPSGASDYVAAIAGTGQTQVKVKYLLAPSVSTKGNFTWAGQTFGGNFASDGRLQGTEDIQTVTCSPDCQIKVPAPGFALVFITEQALSDSHAKTTETFPTSAHTKLFHTATVDPALLATSNGHTAMGSNGGSTSKGSTMKNNLKNGGMGRWEEGFAGMTVLGGTVIVGWTVMVIMFGRG